MSVANTIVRIPEEPTMNRPLLLALAILLVVADSFAPFLDVVDCPLPSAPAPPSCPLRNIVSSDTMNTDESVDIALHFGEHTDCR